MSDDDTVIMGIDPGLYSTGVAVIRGGDYLHGTVLQPKGFQGSVLRRIQVIVHNVLVIQQTYRVNALSIERFAYHGHSTTTTSSMNMLIGALSSLTFCDPHPKCFTHDPLRWGQQLLGTRARKKADVATIISLRLGINLTSKGGGHLTDALGLALVLQDQMKLKQEKEE